MKNKHIAAHMKSAFNYAECSTAERLKVGCVIVKDDRIISIGYNGMPSGWTNVCEDEDFVTKPEVLHAKRMQSPSSQGAMSQVRVQQHLLHMSLAFLVQNCYTHQV